MASDEEKVRAVTSADVIANLKVWFPPRQYAFLQQVAPGTGARHYRWADAIAMSVWPSRGYDIHGIEVKVSRYDWLKELAQPEKSIAIQQYCNRWWIATPDESLILAGELPPTWGHMVMKGSTMRTIVAAPPLEPKPINIDFLASVLRNVQSAEESSIARRITVASEAAAEERSKHYRGKYTSLQEQCDAFEKASGIRLSEYADGQDLGEAVSTLRNLKWRAQGLTSAIRACDDIRSMLNKVQTLSDLKSTLCAGMKATQDGAAAREGKHD